MVSKKKIPLIELKIKSENILYKKKNFIKTSSTIKIPPRSIILLTVTNVQGH